MRRLRGALAFLPSVFLFLVLGGLLYAGLREPVDWAEQRYILGYVTGSHQQRELIPPFGPMTRVDVFQRTTDVLEPAHLYVLGSDAGGRDVLVLIAHGAILSLQVLALVVLARLLLGLLAGLAIGFGSAPVRALTLVASRWLAGFPYLVLAIVLITALSAWSPFWAFVIAMSMVGWRDVAQLTSERIEAVLTQPYAEAATALGSSRLRTFLRHVVPHLRPVLVTEVAFQASATLVLLGELGYLNFFLGTPFSFNQVLLPQPELGALLAEARDYILSEQWTPVLAPAGAIALLALAFELLGLALRAQFALPAERLSRR